MFDKTTALLLMNRISVEFKVKGSKWMASLCQFSQTKTDGWGPGNGWAGNRL